jgi:hypothetical protein
MGRPGATGAAVVLLALTACGASQELAKKEQEAAAAEKKLAETRTFQEGLEREKALLAKALTEASARLAEVQGANRRTRAAAAYLAAEKSNGLMLDADMEAARQGFELEEAARQKDRKALDTLVAAALDDARPCADTEGEPGDGEGDDACEVAPYEDACQGVETNIVGSLEWSCASVERSGEGMPPAAFCTTTVEHPAPGGGVSSVYAERGVDTKLQVVRIAFAHKGRLYVGDHPPPDFKLYNPANVEPLKACTAETWRSKCLHECEVRFDRYEDPCAPVEDTSTPSDPAGDSEDSEYGEEEEEEPYEVRQAREAAEAAEAAAAEAQRAAEAAQAEVQYRECTATCEAEVASWDESDEEEEGRTEPKPEAATVLMRLEANPSPGVFVVTRELRTLAAAGTELEKQETTLVLKHPELASLWQKLPPLEKDRLDTLEEVEQLDEVLRQGGKPLLAPLPGMKDPAIVGLRGGWVKAYAFRTQPGEDPVVALETAAVCAALNAEPKRFPASFLTACNTPQPFAPDPLLKGVPLDGGASGDGGTSGDAGAPGDTGTSGDAGASGDAGGEVSP